MKNCFLLAACVGMAAMASSADAVGLIANWKFDETSGITASDSVGGNDGTLLDNAGGTDLPIWKPAADRSGGGALYFSSATQDYVRVPDFNYGDSGNFTTNIWTKAETNIATGKDWQYFWSTSDFSATGGFNQYLINETDANGAVRDAEDAGSYRIRVHDDNGDNSNVNTTVPGTAQTGDWRMLTITFSTTEGSKYYVDGVLEGTKADVDGPIGSSGADMFFGTRADFNTDRFYGSSVDDQTLGLLDDAAIWDFTLSAGQVMDVFNNGTSNNPVPEPTTLALLMLCTVSSVALRRRSVR